ncbi:hypothetical protein [Demequina pelophila]|uniref:hypothetical protein n=1 Tax=Demequina pelophila TaxID=1638984 RepID=UPI0012E0888F|nr:hypothetical protein [Demequina pelophila]
MRRMLGRWLMLALVVPLIAAALGMIADRLEERSGEPTKVVKGLRAGRSVLRAAS